MARCQEETSTNQVVHMRGPTRELPFASRFVSSVSMEELRSFCQIPDSISLELSNGPATSTVGEADSFVYFTREQFVARLHFPVSSLGKQFLYLPSTSYAHSSERYSDFDVLQCAQPSLPVRYLTGGDLFRLHAEAQD